MVYPLLISSTMVLLTVKMHDLIKVLEIWFNQNWEYQNYFLVYGRYINIVSICGMLGNWMIRTDEMERKIIRNLLDFSRITTSFCLYVICLYSFLGKVHGHLYLALLIIFTTSLLWSIVVGVRFHQALDISTQLSWKSDLINVMVGIIWIIIFVFPLHITISTA